MTTTYAENAILDATFNNEPFAVKARYVQLHVGDPGRDALANIAEETTRKLLESGTAADGVFISRNALVWDDVAADERFSHVSVWDSLTGGNPLWVGKLGRPRSVEEGDQFTIAAGSLAATFRHNNP